MENSELIADRQPGSLLVFADDWGRHPSSCQHLVRQLAKNHKVLWVNTIGTRKIRANGFTVRRVADKLNRWRQGLTRVSDSFWVYDLPMLPVSGSRMAQALNHRWVANRLQAALTRTGVLNPVVLTTLPYVHWMVESVSRAGLIYYCTDDYSHWPDADRAALVEADRLMTRRADVVLAVSQSLLESHRDARRCEFFPHGVDFEHFASAQDAPNSVPDGLAAIDRPRIGFFGLIYEKLDFNLLSAVAKDNPKGSIAMIGPEDYCEPSFRSLANVHFFGRQPYADLPRWIAGLDVLMLPYVNDEMIRQSGPLKLRECLASGKPTVSVDVPEVRKLAPHVRVATDIDGFVGEIRNALTEPRGGLAARKRQQSVQGDGWDGRARRLEELICELSHFAASTA